MSEEGPEEFDKPTNNNIPGVSTEVEKTIGDGEWRWRSNGDGGAVQRC